jgi:hypothetical protein
VTEAYQAPDTATGDIGCTNKNSSEESVLKCALAHIKAGRLSRVTEAYQALDTATSDIGRTNKNSEPAQTMLASWENHKNNKTRRETAITCYQKIEDTDTQGSAKRHKS